MKRFVSVLLLMSGLLVAGGANAAVIITAAEVGSDVVFTFAGTINTAGLNPQGGGTFNSASILDGNIRNVDGNFTVYSSAVASAASGFYTQPFRLADSASVNAGSSFQISPTTLYLSDPYSGGQISSTMTFANTTVTGMGLVSGTYVWTLTNNETITLTISSSPAAVPTLSEWAQLMLALMVIGIAWHFHNNRQNSY